MPVAVKLSPYFSATGEMARRLDQAGADGLVLFNRFLQPDIDPETLAVVPAVSLSTRVGGSAAADVDCVAARTDRRVARRDDRRRERRGADQVPAGRRGRGDDRVSAAAPRPATCRRTARRLGEWMRRKGYTTRRRTAWAARRTRPAPTRPHASAGTTSAHYGKPTAPTTAPGNRSGSHTFDGDSQPVEVFRPLPRRRRRR